MQRRSLFTFLALVVLPQVGDAAERALPEVLWKVDFRGVWPPLLIDDKMVLKSANSLSAYHLANGQLAWKQKLANLCPGPGTIAAGPRYIYLLGKKDLQLLQPGDGTVVHTREIPRSSNVLFRSGSIYVSGGGSILRLNEGASQVLAQVDRIKGDLREAEGDFVVLFTQRPDPAKKGSPKRLEVLNLKSGKVQYEFKLFPQGEHKVIKVSDNRVVFLDYTLGDPGRKTENKLYYTEADYIRRKPVRDINLSSKYTAKLASAFWVTTDSSGNLFLANHGEEGQPSTLLAFDPERGKTLWNRSGQVAGMGLLLSSNQLWTGVASKKEAFQVVSYSPEDGNTLFRISLDAPADGEPVAFGNRVLFRTRRSILCIGHKQPAGAQASSPGQPTEPSPVSPPVGGEPTPRPGWQLFRDRESGFLIQLPQTWHLQKERIVKMGGVRMAIPFAKVLARRGGDGQFLGSVQVLTWEAAGREADGLWQSVYAQRKSMSPDVRVSTVHWVRGVGGSGANGIRAVYTFSDDKGRSVELRSLCVVDHDVAFELRAWAGTSQTEQTWNEIEEIFTTFQPRQF